MCHSCLIAHAADAGRLRWSHRKSPFVAPAVTRSRTARRGQCTRVLPAPSVDEEPVGLTVHLTSQP